MTELTGPVLGEERVQPQDADLTSGHAGRAARRADHRPRPGPRQRRPPGARTLIEVWQANAAGATATRSTSIRPRSTRTSPASAAASPTQGNYRFVTIKPGRLSVAKPPQCLARRAHPLLAVRARVHPAPGDADVLPGRPALHQDPIFNAVPRAEARRTADRAASTSSDSIPEWALGLPLRHRPRAAATRRRSRTWTTTHELGHDAVADGRTRSSRSA